MNDKPKVIISMNEYEDMLRSHEQLKAIKEQTAKAIISVDPGFFGRDYKIIMYEESEVIKTLEAQLKGFQEALFNLKRQDHARREEKGKSLFQRIFK